MFDEMTAAIDDRTLAILDRRRRTAVVKRRGWLVRRMLLLADIVGLAAAFLLAEWFVRIGHGPADHVDLRGEVLIFALSLPAWIVVTKLYGLYDHDEERTDHSTADDIVGVFHMVTVCSWLLFAFAYCDMWRIRPCRSWCSFGRWQSFWCRSVERRARTYCRGSFNYLQNTIIVGAGEVGQLVGRQVLNHPEYGINLVGFVDAEPEGAT